MLFAIGFIGLAALAGTVLLVRYIAAGDSRLMLWTVLLALATALASLLGQLASIYYKLPWGWVVVIAAALLVVTSLVWLVGTSGGWKTRRIVAIVALMLLSTITLMFVMIAVPSGALMMPLFDARAQQIAEANGFDILLPADLDMDTDAGLPVGVTSDGEGVSLGYKRFILVERKADGAIGYAELEALVAPGERPAGDVGPGSLIARDAEYTELEVEGRPAIGVSYQAATEEKADDLLGTDSVNILVFERDGVLVVLYSQGYMEYQPDETYTRREALSFDELTGVGESLEPLE